MEPIEGGPIEGFENCHAGILRRLQALAGLPALLETAARAHALAADSLEFFREAIFEHHLDEERELFPAVLQAAQAEERAAVQALVNRLTQEHRELEQLWKRLEPGLKRAARGQFEQVEAAEVERLVERYGAHARFEETEFLPRARGILGRHDGPLADLALSLHHRHAPGFGARRG